ncbi:hypothetical protein [Bacillus xiapuensis]|uniref:hypothetical protein n=1 Tax=Bacillus xiapuensis TaxID=2014075 RepID=UPI000C2349FC|nr:hypothetical protein [Bacillus xiapuensis]
MNHQPLAGRTKADIAASCCSAFNSCIMQDRMNQALQYKKFGELTKAAHQIVVSQGYKRQELKYLSSPPA